jgi:hypothetical protein
MITLLFTVLISHAAFGDEGWLKGSANDLCKSVRYEIACQNCEDGWNQTIFMFKKIDRSFGKHFYATCGSGNNCGDSFSIEKLGKVKCEKFVEEIQKQHKKCGKCLEAFSSSGG